MWSDECSVEQGRGAAPHGYFAHYLRNGIRKWSKRTKKAKISVL